MKKSRDELYVFILLLNIDWWMTPYSYSSKITLFTKVYSSFWLCFAHIRTAGSPYVVRFLGYPLRSYHTRFHVSCRFFRMPIFLTTSGMVLLSHCCRSSRDAIEGDFAVRSFSSLCESSSASWIGAALVNPIANDDSFAIKHGCSFGRCCKRFSATILFILTGAVSLPACLLMNNTHLLLV